MSQAPAIANSVTSLTGLLVPLADRTLLLPNVVVAELIPYRAPQVTPGMPAWFLGHRDRAMNIGVNEYLGKPYQESLLLESIARLVVRHQDKRT